jgi:tetratricopeptide (TPR) repeat protein
MASRRADPQISQLWQLPLLLLSFALFAYAAYLFIDPRPGPTPDQKLVSARNLLRAERPVAAIEQLNRILATEKLTQEQLGQTRLMLAEALDQGQKQRNISLPVNHFRIIEQTRLAMATGVKADAAVYRRLGESYEAVDKPTEALENYRRAMTLDAARNVALRKKIITMLLDRGDTGPAKDELETYLADVKLSPAERSWALGEKAQILADAEQYIAARVLLDEAIKLVENNAQAPTPADQAAAGIVQYRYGYVAQKLGQVDDAERHLRLSRDLLTVSHPLDADAALGLGQLYQGKGDTKQAMTFFQDVIVSHPDSKIAPLARLGRGVCRLVLGEDEAGLSDLHDLVGEQQRKPSRAKYKDQLVSALQRGQQLLQSRDNTQGVLELLAYEQQLVGDPNANFFGRLGAVYERRADQVEKSLAQLVAPNQQPERIRRSQQVRDFRVKAGQSYVAYSQKLTLADDSGYGDALWKGVDLFDRAGDVDSVIGTLELFTAERPEDKLAPDALLRLGRAYQAAGLFDKAIEAFQRNQFRYPQSLAASKSGVPLAQAFLAKGPDFYNKAEKTLLAVIDNNPLLTPEAEEFKQALFELAGLYYRTARYEESVGRLEEFTQRYPGDDRVGQLLFLMADSYRKSASLLDVRLAASGPGAVNQIDPKEAADARKQRLGRARELYDRVVDHYKNNPPAGDTDKLYARLAWFYRADCLYDLGDFAGSIPLYEAAASRYEKDPSSLSAYVQIVNAYCALGKEQEARAANERAKWLLRRIPPEAFQQAGAVTLQQQNWEKWLKWSSQSGLWNARDLPIAGLNTGTATAGNQ